MSWTSFCGNTGSSLRTDADVSKVRADPGGAGGHNGTAHLPASRAAKARSAGGNGDFVPDGVSAHGFVADRRHLRGDVADAAVAGSAHAHPQIDAATGEESAASAAAGRAGLSAAL